MAFDPTQPFTVEDAKVTAEGFDPYERNKAWTKPGPRNFYTSLPAADEERFQAWVKANKVPFDPGPKADYDMRGFWRALEAGDPRAKSAVDPNDGQLHYPDYWKTPHHETFSRQSQWATDKAPDWDKQDRLVTPDGKVLFDDRAQRQPEQSIGGFDPSKPFEVVAPEQKASNDIFDQAKKIGGRVVRGLSALGNAPGDAIKALAERQYEDVSTGYADKPGYTYGSVLPFRKNEATGAVEWGYSPEAARVLMRAAQMDPMKFDINDPAQRDQLTAVASAMAGLHRAPGGLNLGGPGRMPPGPRVEPGFGPEGPSGPPALLEGPRPALPGPGGAPVEPPPGAITRPTPPAEPLAAAPPALNDLSVAKAKIQEGVGLAQRYAEEIKTLRDQGATPEMLAPAIARNRSHLEELQSFAEQVRDREQALAPATTPAAEPDWYQEYLRGVRSLVPEDWAPAEPKPAEPTSTAAEPALVPDATPRPPAAEPPSVDTFEDMRIAGYDRNTDHPLAGRVDHLRELAESPDLTPTEQRDVQSRIRHFEGFIEATNELPTEQRDMVRSLRPDDIISGVDTDGRPSVGRVDGFDRRGRIGITDANGFSRMLPASGVTDVRRVNQSGLPISVALPADEKKQKAEPPVDTAHGGPWVRVKTKAGEDASNRQGEALYENPNGLRATFENGVPYTESSTEHPEKGLVPKNAMDRRGQFLTAEETGLGAAPPKPRSDDKGGIKKPEEKRPESRKDDVTPIKPEPKPAVEKPPELKPEWTEIGKNADGLPVFSNDQGVHSTVENGVRTVEPVRMRPTREGMRVSVPPPEDKAPEYQVVPTSGSSTTKEEAKPEAHTESTPAEPETVTHTTRKGKVLTGTIRKDLTLDEAKALDPYAFKKDGGYFIRSKPGAAPAQPAAAKPKAEAKPTGPVAAPTEEAPTSVRQIVDRVTDGKMTVPSALRSIANAAANGRATAAEVREALDDLNVKPDASEWQGALAIFPKARDLMQSLTEQALEGEVIAPGTPETSEGAAIVGGGIGPWAPSETPRHVKTGLRAGDKVNVVSLQTGKPEPGTIVAPGVSNYPGYPQVPGWAVRMDDGFETIVGLDRVSARDAPIHPQIQQISGSTPIPSPTDKLGPRAEDVSDWEIAQAKDRLDDRDEDDQIDRVLDLLSKGWTPGDISEEPGIDLTPREIAALDIAEIQDAEERELPAPKRPTAKGQGDLLKPIPSSLDVAEQHVKNTNATLPGYDPKTGELVDPDAVFADILANSLEDPDHVITGKGLMMAAEGIYGGTLASGILKRDRLYDAIELGVNTFITRHPERFAPTSDLASAKGVAAELAALKDRIPTQTVRAGDKIKLQQFSTPPDYAFAAAWVANIKPGEVVIEPSAGTGGIAVHAMNAGAKVIGNEISPQRRAMMETLPFERITAENAEQLHNILPRSIKPTVVVMNPPFSSAGDRMGGKMVLETGAVHIEQALKRLEPGGRLVAIVGDGMKPLGAETAGKGGRNNATGAAFRDWWKKIGESYDVRANIGVGGEIYRKYGTTFPTRLLVIDKVAPSGQPPVVTTAITAEELLDALSGVRDARPGSADQPVADQPGGAPLAPGGQGASGPTGAVRPPTGGVGAGGGQDRPTRPDLSKPANTGGGQTGGVRSGGGAGPSGGVRSDAPTVQQPKPLPQGGAGQSGQQPVPSQEPGGSGTGGDTSHTRPDGSDLAVTPPAPELLETSIIVPEEQTGGELSESVYEDYKPQRITIEGAQAHPGPLVQSAAMASVLPPVITYKTALPKKLIMEGAVSAAQLEAIVYAGNAHTQMLEKGKDGVARRRGFFIGDGTGVGKGREVAGIILDNKWQGRKKAVWVSEKMPLSNDARRDWAGLGQNPNEILVHNKIKAGDDIKHDGILFTTYDTVKSGEKLGAEHQFKDGDRVHWHSDAGDPSKTQAGTIVGKSSKAIKGGSWTIKVDDGTTQQIGDRFLAPEGKPFGEPGEAAKPKTRVQQIVDWLGKDFDGVIAFDEAHNMANAVGEKGKRGQKDASQKALAGLELQNALPNARVVYVSATGATEVNNLAYADRLGLWGPGTAFANRNDFLSRVSSGGVAAMELVARDMKALGYYTARSLSYDGVEYDRVQHDLTPPQRIMYDKIADAWQIVLRNMMEALAETGADGKGGPKSAIMSAFWGGHQRFFNQLITSLQMPSVIEGIDKDLAEGRQAVLQLVNTNEAGQERALDKSKARGDEDLEELDMSPRDQLLQLVDKAFPTRQYETYVDEDGNERVRPVSDSEGKPVHNPEAVAAKEKLLLDLGSLRVPDGPLEILINHYGPEAVAEVTGRKQRVVNKADETGKMKKVVEKRGSDANVAEANSFQSGKKKILIFSQAGGTGRSYHDDRTADRVDESGRLGIGGNGARRSHYLVQAGWRADTAVQGFGRTHRTNQWTAPIFHLVTTDLEGQKRFISSIARRLGQLGALTRGERRTGDQGMFGLQDNLESDEAKAGLTQLFRDIHGGRVEGFTTDDLAEQMGLYIENPDGSLKDELPPMTQFLNRVLSLKVNDQNRVFNEFATRFRDIVDRAAAAGTLDAGTETYKADKIVKASDQVVYTDPNSGAETRHVHLVTSTRNYPVSFQDVMSGQSSMTGWQAPEFFVQNKRSGYISAVAPTTFTKVEANGMVTEYYRVATPISWDYVPKDDMEASTRSTGTLNRVTNITDAKKLWNERVAKTPEFRESDLHIITGAILPIWDRLSGHPKIFRLQTDAGERMLGRVVDNKVINETLTRLGAESVKLNVKPAEVVERILDGGTASLANGWTIKRRRVANEYRLELVGDDLYSHTAELEAAGVFRERIPGSYDTRYFIPSGDNGALTIEAITKRRSITSLGEN